MRLQGARRGRRSQVHPVSVRLVRSSGSARRPTPISKERGNRRVLGLHERGQDRALRITLSYSCKLLNLWNKIAFLQRTEHLFSLRDSSHVQNIAQLGNLALSGDCDGNPTPEIHSIHWEIGKPKGEVVRVSSPRDAKKGTGLPRRAALCPLLCRRGSLPGRCRCERRLLEDYGREELNQQAEHRIADGTEQRDLE